MSIYAAAASLFFVLNAVGNVPFFVGMLGRYDLQRQRKIIFREMLIALGILLAFNFFGRYIFQVLGISPHILAIAGGVLLFIISLSMVFPKAAKVDVPPDEPLIVPLAIPIIAGPGGITTVMVYADQVNSSWGMTLAILIAWIPSFLILLAASNIKVLLGPKGMTACERVGGMLICLFAVQMLSTGIFSLIKTQLA